MRWTDGDAQSVGELTILFVSSVSLSFLRHQFAASLSKTACSSSLLTTAVTVSHCCKQARVRL